MGEAKRESVRETVTEFHAGKERELASLRLELSDRQAEILQNDRPERNTLENNVIGMYGAELADHIEILENYDKVADSLAGKRGQPVLVVKRWLETVRSADLSGQQEKLLRRSYSLGKLSSEILRFEFSREGSLFDKAYMPTKKFASSRQSGPCGEEETVITSGPIAVSGCSSILEPDVVYLGYDFGRYIDTDDMLKDFSLAAGFGNIQHGPPIALEVIAGTAQIQAWIDERGLRYGGHDFKGEYAALRQLAGLLGIAGIEPTTEHLRQYYLKT